MAVLRIHHSCLSIAHEVLAKVLVECVAVALELREFVRPALILVFGPRRLLAETLRMTKVLRHLLTKSAALANCRRCCCTIEALARLPSRFRIGFLFEPLMCISLFGRRDRKSTRLTSIHYFAYRMLFSTYI